MRRHPLDYPLRGFRVLVAMWLIVAPFLLGFADNTFVQRQDAVAGLLLLVSALVGLLVPGTRVMFLVVGAWLMMSPSFSYAYAAGSLPFWHDRIVGLLCLFVGVLPLRETMDVTGSRREPARVPADGRGRRWTGWSYVHRRPVTFEDVR